ncbi:NAD(P)-binding protein [Morchella conica CCBAS932]|uniref:Very-long-chain 3-oxoacyl-CoA reductase n=1 Tax=Morchella conica CCBAS932 TaxID=1392247 RepID=A0A3N4L4Z5_9PEZI|nr:NAD(P)-binding protein [Morchella conica CCBAS932]
MASLVNEAVAKISSTLGPFAIPALAVFGALSVLSIGLKAVNAILSLFILSGTNLRKFGPKGSWALVTGASDGIGKEFSLQLAAKGFNILLVSRTESKLATLATEIESKYASTQTKILPMDFAANDSADYDRLAALIKDFDIAILVNNVGKSHDIPVPFLETTHKEMNDIITINITGTLKVTQLVAPGMAARKRGLILTMGSFGGLLPTPFLATYSGSKAFLQYWSTALGAELKRDGVEVQLVVGYLITSAMSKVRKPSMMIPTPKGFVKACLGKIGVKGTAAGMEGTITPYWAHGLMHWGVTALGIFNGTVLMKNLGMNVSIRKRALKKREREAAQGKKGL